MKIVVVGLEGAAPELLLDNDGLANLRQLMAAGCYGRLESVVPPTASPAWQCLVTGQDPGSLGVYGRHQRADYSYAASVPERPGWGLAPALWEQMAAEGQRCILIGLPGQQPPDPVNGIWVGRFKAQGPAATPYTFPATVMEEIAEAVGEYPSEPEAFNAAPPDHRLQAIYAMSRKHFEVARHFLQNTGWGYFHFAEIGLGYVQRAFWPFHDPRHPLHEPGGPYQNAIRDYYHFLDAELGQMLELLDADAAMCVVSTHRAQRIAGGFCLNEWLVQQGLLTLRSYPREVRPFSDLSIDWSRTRAWFAGGDSAQITLNVRGREPEGLIAPEDYEATRDEIKSRLESAVDDQGRPMGMRLFKPQEIYQTVRNVAPDLIVQFTGPAWQPVAGVGHAAAHLPPAASGVEACGPAQPGLFVLAAPGLPLVGEVEGAHLLDIAPTLLQLAGCAVPATMQGRSLLAGAAAESPDYSADEEALLRERLSGLGYLG